MLVGTAQALMTGIQITFSSLVMLAASCAQPKHVSTADSRHKIEFDLTQLDSNGLRGPVDGKVAVSYEFAIPNTDVCRVEVAAIDNTVQFIPGSSGRIRAGENQCLCIGSTHQESFREVLHSLAGLPYIHRIIVCHFE